MRLIPPARILLQSKRPSFFVRLLTNGCTSSADVELSNALKLNIEKHWRPSVSKGQFDPQKDGNKYYVLCMFPYPSGKLHMGHVRVYTTSDAMARFHRMCGKNVFQPIGWDAFGLPAENAAMQNGVDAASWTKQNINQMRDQLKALSASFDWNHEISTCNADYFKWTQYLFLMMHKEGLAYQNEALVNWDPVDKTVLADEQVDANGISWRSGAKAERKFLRQWFIRTSVFASKLLENLDDPALQDWRDVESLQRHWIGDCNGYSFMLLTSASNFLRVWTENPEHLKDPSAFIVLRPDHYLSKLENVDRLTVENPFAGTSMPVVFSDAASFAEKCDVYLAAPSFSKADDELREKCRLVASINPSMNENERQKLRTEVIEAGIRLKIGGHRISSKLQDWLISRQRYWGTPIPIIHCDKCGAVPVPIEQLPVLLPQKNSNESVDSEAYRCTCPNCGNENARRDTDTMDTFVDSSWYYIRFLDPGNTEKMFDARLAKKFMPVDLYIGGKEHALLHLYYARFVSHFLHSKGLLNQPEPFTRMLVQGMVMGRSYCLKGSGKYVTEDQVEIIDASKNRAILKETKEPVIMSWEKMSKSKMNGVDPTDLFEQYGADTIRLVILADVAPTSHRNWSSATFPGILNWQNRLWLTLRDFHKVRSAQEYKTIDTSSDEKFQKEELKLFDARNFYIKGATFNYRHTHQLSVAISKMQGLTNSIRRASKDVMRYGQEYERALASQIIMLAPMAPHFASELWFKFVEAPGRLNEDSDEIAWDKDVLEQKWPSLDMNYELDLTVKINGFENCVIKVTPAVLNKLNQSEALDLAFSRGSVVTYLANKKIRNTNFVLYSGIEAVLNIYADKLKQTSAPSSDSSKETLHK